MGSLSQKLDELGLSDYHESLVREGFDTWDTVLDITESDLTSLGFKLGHRRKLQRAIAAWRRESGEPPLSINQSHIIPDDEDHSDDDELDGRAAASQVVGAPQVAQKRKYKRHPKRDSNAPDRPPSAYVIFSNQMREVLKGQELSFSETAKLVGDRWRSLSPASRDACDKQAAAFKKKYHQELNEYKKTAQYEEYQRYLKDFKDKHAEPQDGKRSKLEAESLMSITDMTGDESSSHHQPSVARSSGSHSRSTSTEQARSVMAAGAHLLPSAPSPNPGRRFVSVNSPQHAEAFSPKSASPRSAGSYRDSTYGVPGFPALDSRDRRSNPSPTLGSAPSYSPPQSNPSASPLPPFLHASDPGMRRRTPLSVPGGPHTPSLARNDSSAPSLVHTDTTVSSSSDSLSRRSSHVTTPHLPTHLPPIDAPKSMRILPQPIPTSLPSLPGIAADMPMPLAGLPTRFAPPWLASEPISSATTPATSDLRQGWTALVLAADLARHEAEPDPRVDAVDRPP